MLTLAVCNGIHITSFTLAAGLVSCILLTLVLSNGVYVTSFTLPAALVTCMLTLVVINGAYTTSITGTMLL